MSFKDTNAIPGYEILSKLNSGGMADVLLARPLGEPEVEVLAIKIVRGDLVRRPGIRAMFLHEARLLAQLDHPTIPRAYHFGEFEGRLYLAMEYVPGIALNRLLLERKAPLPPLAALQIMAHVAGGLHFAHELVRDDGHPMGVVHRDVSPGNIILTFEGRVKVLDFGIAFSTERRSPSTEVEAFKGKPSYMSPEQMRGETVDRRSDIYSLCIVLYELLTGRKLFEKHRGVATLVSKERVDFPPPSALVRPSPGGWPEDIDALVMQGLAPRREDRFATAGILAGCLDEVVAAHGVDAGGLSPFVDGSLSAERSAHQRWLQTVLTKSPSE